MNGAAKKGTHTNFDLAINLDSTRRLDSEFSPVRWDRHILKHGTIQLANCSAFNVLDPKIYASSREHIMHFYEQKKYSTGSFASIFGALNYALKKYPTYIIDLAWVANAVTLSSFINCVNGIRSFFIFWQDRYPGAITSDALHFLASSTIRKKPSKNVLSDDPEKSWLTDLEYDAVLRCVWDNYDQGLTETQVTLMRLLSLQYARRSVQLARLKVGDFCESAAADSDPIGRHIRFPGAKDRGADTNFRDSKVEIHPAADHLWNLFYLRKIEIKRSFEMKLGRVVNDYELASLPVFISDEHLGKAIKLFSEHYSSDWRANLNHRVFHLSSAHISALLGWHRNRVGNIGDYRKNPKVPISHRTGRPIVINATRMRHTRARQLARLGTPKHVLSFWLGHETDLTLDAYYDDPAEEARKINEKMKGSLAPLAMVFTGKLLDDQTQATFSNNPENTLEFAANGDLKQVGNCGKHSFCATTSVPIPCYRCKMFEPLVEAPHEEVLHALLKRQAEENAVIKIGGIRNLLTPIDLSPDIRAVETCIAQCDARKAELAVIRG